MHFAMDKDVLRVVWTKNQGYKQMITQYYKHKG